VRGYFITRERHNTINVEGFTQSHNLDPFRTNRSRSRYHVMFIVEGPPPLPQVAFETKGNIAGFLQHPCSFHIFCQGIALHRYPSRSSTVLFYCQKEICPTAGQSGLTFSFSLHERVWDLFNNLRISSHLERRALRID
jgi:hypothetical protein